jgi:hypothetical protein
MFASRLLHPRGAAQPGLGQGRPAGANGSVSFTTGRCETVMVILDNVAYLTRLGLHMLAIVVYRTTRTMTVPQSSSGPNFSHGNGFIGRHMRVIMHLKASPDAKIIYWHPAQGACKRAKI